MTRTCPSCSENYSMEDLRNQKSCGHDGKYEFNCSNCGQHLTTEFYCTGCESWFGGRCMLKRKDNGSVAKYVCPNCDGLIRNGNVLDIRQGTYR